MVGPFERIPEDILAVVLRMLPTDRLERETLEAQARRANVRRVDAHLVIFEPTQLAKVDRSMGSILFEARTLAGAPIKARLDILHGEIRALIIFGDQPDLPDVETLRFLERTDAPKS